MDNLIFGSDLLDADTDTEILLGRTCSYGNSESHSLEKQSLQDAPASL